MRESENRKYFRANPNVFLMFKILWDTFRRDTKDFVEFEILNRKSARND